MVRTAAGALRDVGSTRRVPIDGIDLSLWELDGGEASIVFIHGNSGCKEAFHEQFRFFAGRGYALIAVDLPGHGESGDATVANAQYTIPAYAALIARLMAHLGLDNPILVGWSLGGHIAIEMIGQGVDMAGAVIVGTPPAGPGAAELGEAFLPSPAAGVTMSENPAEADLRLYTNHLYGTLDPIPELFVRTARRTDGRARRIMGEHWSGAGEGCHQRSVVADSARPIGVVHGMADPFVCHEYLRGVVWGRLWGGEILRLDGIGHAAFLEAPDRFNRFLLDFARECFFNDES